MISKNGSTVEKQMTQSDSTKLRVGDLLWLYRKPSIILIHVLGGIMAFFVPDDILSTSTLLRDFVAAVNLILPIVSNSARHSLFPQVTQLYVAVMLCTSPYWVYVALRWPDLEKSKVLMLNTACRTFGKRVLLHILPFFLIVTLYVYFFKVEITDLHLAPFQHERWALAVFGPVFYCWMVSGIYSAVVIPFEVLIRYWKGE